MLKGEGAILWGATDPGGIVNIVTKEPLNVPYYAANPAIGSLPTITVLRSTPPALSPMTRPGSTG